MYGIVELKDMASAVAQTASAIEGVFEDGKVNLSDLARMPALLSALQAFSKVDFDLLIPEAKDLTTDEAKQLADHFKTVFNLKNDSVEGMVESGLSLIITGIEAIQSIRDIASQIKVG